MLLYGLAILLTGPPNKSLLKAHIWILIIADFTHWSGLFWTIAQSSSAGWAGVTDTAGWDADTWNLVLYPLGTLAIKFMTLAGVFGKIGA